MKQGSREASGQEVKSIRAPRPPGPAPRPAPRPAPLLLPLLWLAATGVGASEFPDRECCDNPLYKFDPDTNPRTTFQPPRLTYSPPEVPDFPEFPDFAPPEVPPGGRGGAGEPGEGFWTLGRLLYEVYAWRGPFMVVEKVMF